MNILVFSDSHAQISSLNSLMGYGPLHKTVRPAYIFHLGDHARDTLLLRTIAPVVTVRGNCDPHGDAPPEVLLDLEGVRILLTHGHAYRVKSSLLGLCLRAQEVGASIALFGHTHIAHLSERDGITLFNPGSISAPRVGQPSYGILRLRNGAAVFEHRHINV